MQKESIKKIENKGFTLIEILVVIGLIALLAAIVIIAINPARQFAQGRNTQRTSNVNAILNAIGQYTADNKGNLPTGIDDTKRYIKKPVTPATDIDLCTSMVIVPTYMPSLPTDPKLNTAPADCITDYTTDYTVQLIGSGRIQVCAPDSLTETALPAAPEICVTR